MVGGLPLQAIGMGWIALIAEPGMAYGAAGRAVHRRRLRRLDGDSGRAELGRRVGAARTRSARRPGTNSMMRELGGVFGIAILVAVFVGAGGYASPQAFSDGFAPAIAVTAGLSFAGATVGLGLPGRRAARAAPGVPAPEGA